MIKKLVASCLLGASLLMPLNGHARLTSDDCIAIGLTMAYCIWGDGSPSKKASIVYRATVQNFGEKFADASAQYCLLLANYAYRGEASKAVNSLTSFVKACILKTKPY